MADQPDKPKRRWLRFSLRTLFVLLTVTCLVLGWKVNKANQQRKAVEWVEKMGGNVIYEHEISDHIFLEDAELPEWQRNLFGVDFLSNVDSVTFLFPPADMSDISPLASLTGLKNLALSGPQITDIEPLAKLTDLEIIWISGTQVIDLSPLAGLTKLQHLIVTDCPVSDEEIKQLQQALPNLTIERDRYE